MSTTPIKGFIARDKDGALFFHARKPKRHTAGEIKYWVNRGYRFLIPDEWDVFLDVTWNGDPVPMELSFKPIVNKAENEND